jgi:hypothetical protein
VCDNVAREVRGQHHDEVVVFGGLDVAVSEPGLRSSGDCGAGRTSLSARFAARLDRDDASIHLQMIKRMQVAGIRRGNFVARTDASAPWRRC